MLRLAARVDPDQYVTVSSLREGRMTAHCRKALESVGWAVTTNRSYTKPDAELDVLATKGAVTLILELKSILRPESPWEAHKRNADILKGIGQVELLQPRIDGDAVGVVLTDGYRGDHDTWAAAIKAGVPTGTIDDLEMVAQAPERAYEMLAEKAGIGLDGAEGEPLPIREFKLAGWTIRLIDDVTPGAP